MAAAAGVTALSANAQVVFVDFAPDININDTFGYVDLNQDAQNDFFINQVDYTGPTYYPGTIRQAAMSGIYPQNMMVYYTFPYTAPVSGVIENVISSGYVTSSMNFASSGWLDNKVNNPYFSFDIGQFHTTGIVGVQFEIGSNIHYGWLRLLVNPTPEHEVIIYDGGYEATPNTPCPILLTPGVDEYGGVSVEHIQQGDALQVTLGKPMGMELVDLQGRVVATSGENSQHTIDVTGLTGVYLIHLDNGGSKKIYLR